MNENKRREEKEKKMEGLIYLYLCFACSNEYDYGGVKMIREREIFD